jgi:hypothetical protein
MRTVSMLSANDANWKALDIDLAIDCTGPRRFLPMRRLTRCLVLRSRGLRASAGRLWRGVAAGHQSSRVYLDSRYTLLDV